jgi:hypothetical protein
MASVALALTQAPQAAASPPGPATLSTGFVADRLIADYPSQSGAWIGRMAQLGSTWTRIGAYWSLIAPRRPPLGFDGADAGDPSYNWSYLDTAVRNATASRQHVLLTLAGPPSWALGAGAARAAFRGTWRPNAAAYGAFAHAVAERYSGTFPDPEEPGNALPRVAAFQAWNEPNLPNFLEPQWTRTPHGYVPASPSIYRRLLNALYANVKAVQPSASVLAAGLAPYGDPPGQGRMRPVAFLRKLLCLQGPSLRRERCGDPAHFDAIDEHPYALTPTIHAYNRDDVSLPDVGRLARVLSAAERSGGALPKGSKPIWVTEVDWDSDPPDRAPGAVSLSHQASYVSLALYELWAQGVSHVFWFEVRDPGFAAKSLTGSGLFFSRGGAKPATTAFRFPFVAVSGGGGMSTLWGRAPAPGIVTVELYEHHQWRPFTLLRTTSGGVFYGQRRLGPNLLLRARERTVVSYPWLTR